MNLLYSIGQDITIFCIKILIQKKIKLYINSLSTKVKKFKSYKEIPLPYRKSEKNLNSLRDSQPNQKNKIIKSRKSIFSNLYLNKIRKRSKSKAIIS